MKKIILIAMAVLMVAGVAYAEDRLSLNGSFRIRGQSLEASDWDGDTENDYWTQRLRIGGKIAVADDVTVNFRMDFGEGTWGDSFGPGGGYVVRPRGANGTTNSSQLDIDRAYVEINKDFWELSAGQQFLGLGVSEVLDANVPSIVLRIKPAEQMKFSLIYAKIDENGDTTDTNTIAATDIYEDPYYDETTGTYIPDPDGPTYAAGDTVSTEDVDFYAANFSYDADAFSLKVYYGMQIDDTPAEDEPSGGGIYASTKLGMVNLQAELDFFGGDAADGTDYTGTQFFLAGDAAVSEMIKVGAELFYALGDEDDQQITGFCDWYTFTPMTYNTPQSANYSAFEPNGTTSPFDPSGDGAGAMGATLWADFAVMEGLKLGAKVGYWEVEEDDASDMDSIFSWNAYVSYMIASNSELSLTYISSTPDWDVAGMSDDTYKVGVLQMLINF